MFAQGEKSDVADDLYNRNDKPARNLEHITWNDCGEKGHFAVITDWLFQVQLRKGAEAYRESQKDYGSNNKSTN